MEKPLTILDTQLVQSTLVAFGTLLAYDYLCTLDQEVAYVWASPWSAGTILFFLNRYLPFIDTFLSLKLKFSFNKPETCLRQFKVVTWFILSGIILSEAILMLRTYALWERRRSILLILCVTSTIAFVPAIIVTQLEIQSLRYLQSDLPGCRIGAASPIIIVAYILLMLSETTMAILTGIKAFRHLRHSQSPWVIQLYRDGILFYFYLLLISIANVLVPIFAPRIFANWLATPQRVMHSLLCNRVLLLILKQRSASNMTARLPNRNNGEGPVFHQDPVFTSFDDEEFSTNMTIISPHSHNTNTFSSLHADTSTTQDIEYSRRGIS